MLFLFPQDVVPGVLVPLDEDLKADAVAERDAMIKALRILTSRPDWVTKVLAVWKKIDDEKWQDIKMCVSAVFRIMPSHLLWIDEVCSVE